MREGRLVLSGPLPCTYRRLMSQGLVWLSTSLPQPQCSASLASLSTNNRSRECRIGSRLAYRSEGLGQPRLLAPPLPPPRPFRRPAPPPPPPVPPPPRPLSPPPPSSRPPSHSLPWRQARCKKVLLSSKTLGLTSSQPLLLAACAVW